ncbi:MAG: hypothetical protein MI924_32665 [Chloroflexales bacterium]|nr:hypothetical protein [Chloroflexales bacterium]
MITPNADQIIKRFHEELPARRGEVCDYLARACDALGARGIELPFQNERFPLTPAILPSSWIAVLENGCRAVFEGIELLFHQAFAGDVQRLAAFLKLTEEEQRLYDIANTAYDWAAVARPDMMVWGDRLALVETNITTAIGLLADGDMLRQITSEMPVFDDIARGYNLRSIDPIKQLCRLIRATVPDTERKLLALVEWEHEIPKWRYYYEYLAQELTHHGIPSALVSIESLRVTDNGVYDGTRRVDVIYRFFTTVHLRQPELFQRYEPLFAAIRHGKALLLGNFAHKLFTPKMFLALLSDEVYVRSMPERVRQDLMAIVPWTRLVEERHTLYKGGIIDLVPYATAHKDDFVLKPNLGFGGLRVTIGCDVTQSEWEAGLEEALRSEEHWLLQELIPTNPVNLAFCINGAIEFAPVFVDYGVFMLDRCFAGVARRNSTPATCGRLTNLSQGGGLGFAFFLP